MVAEKDRRISELEQRLRIEEAANYWLSKGITEWASKVIWLEESLDLGFRQILARANRLEAERRELEASNLSMLAIRMYPKKKRPDK